jgi:hypothetical protein
VLKHLEAEWFNKWVPNNYKYGPAIYDKISNINFNCLAPPGRGTVRYDINAILQSFFPEIKVRLLPREVFRINPPHSQASLGCTWDPEKEILYAGAKQKVWAKVQLLAYDIFNLIVDKYGHLSFDRAYAEMKHDRLLDQLAAHFLPFLRLIHLAH